MPRLRRARHDWGSPYHCAGLEYQLGLNGAAQERWLEANVRASAPGIFRVSEPAEQQQCEKSQAPALSGGP
jgi:hypothetical protein